MLTKNNLTCGTAEVCGRRFPTSGSHFMTNIFRKIEIAATQMKVSEPPRNATQTSPNKNTHQSNSRASKKSLLLHTREARLNSCSKQFQIPTPNSKSFDIAHKSSVSPEINKKSFLMNYKKLKTILGKNLLEQRPKNAVHFPEKANATRQIGKTLTKGANSKVASARTSPQLSKIRTPILNKIASKDKSSIYQPIDSSSAGGMFKPLHKTMIGEIKNSKSKLLMKLQPKHNKENSNSDENALKRPNIISDANGSTPQDQHMLRSLSQKNCIFANFLGTTSVPNKEGLKIENNASIFKQSFADKFSVEIFELHCTQVTGMRDLMSGHGHPLDVLLEGYVRSLKHPSFLDLSAELRTEMELGRSFELSFKQEIMFLLFVVPMLHSNKLSIKVQKNQAFETICLNLLCFSKALKQHFRTIGRAVQADKIDSIVKTTALCTIERTPIKVNEYINENNLFLRSLIVDFVEKLPIVPLRKTMHGLLKKMVDSDLFQFAMFALESFLSFFERFHETTSVNEPDNAVPGDSAPRGASFNSLYFEEDDPYFILQPLKIERYLPDKPQSEKSLTLVLDLDETLVHFTENENNGKFLVRPFAREFLLRLQNYYEIVVFTAALKDYADWILDRIDTAGSIRYRLYRDHTTFQNGVYLKDLSRLNRDLSKTIIVDNNPDNFQMHPENGIYIKSWYEDPNDLALKHLTNVLIRIAESSESDIRRALAQFNRKIATTKDSGERVN